MSNQLLNLPEFSAKNLSFTEPKKDKYNNVKSLAIYKDIKCPTIRVNNSLFTFGVQSIPLFSNKKLESGNYQVCLSPYSNNHSPDEKNSREVMFEKVMNSIRDSVIKEVSDNKEKYGFSSKLTKEDILDKVSPIFWRKKDSKGEYLKGEEARTYLYLKLISKVPTSLNGGVDQSKISPSNIKTFFDAPGGKPIEPKELINNIGFIYPDIRFKGFLCRKGVIKLQFDLVEATFIPMERKRIGNREVPGYKEDDIDYDFDQ